MEFCLRNCHIWIAWDCAIALLVGEVIDIERPFRPKTIAHQAVSAFLVMCSVLFRGSECCETGTFWPNLTSAMIPLI
jgi:hypothetical protein